MRMRLYGCGGATIGNAQTERRCSHRQRRATYQPRKRLARQSPAPKPPYDGNMTATASASRRERNDKRIPTTTPPTNINPNPPLPYPSTPTAASSPALPTPARASQYSRLSASASQLASMMFSDDPTVRQTPRPSVDSISTRTTEPVPLP